MEQWRQALELANAQREAIAELRERLAKREIGLADALADPVASRLTVERVVGWQYRVGPIKTHKRLAKVGIGPHKLCGHLSPRQRERLEDPER